ncbi:M23 family metallopeptidase [Tahibacter soli]|uniref:M23 family metallopeptidase n=1 Tax=Tahibacter soli TaxID=2983605 RepID=A0A9X4BFL4_9GAMM|nr:M23 family metallopeptidase [Tahibacter soli]MDC8011325.1 M23 family metallopeptidase [Tahibacter soli]
MAPNFRLIAALALTAAALPVAAKKIYKYTDANGITHFTDVKPATDRPVEETAIKAAGDKRWVALRIEGSSGERQARVFNNLSGPTEVEISAGAIDNITSTPALPLKVVLQANEERVLANLVQTDPSRRASFELAMRAMPGDPRAQASDVEYRWPLGTSQVAIGQGFGGSFSHTDDESRYAIDIAADEGTPVLAARDGVVMQVEDDYYGAGLDREKFGTRANVVRVLHADGSMAIYAHLRPESVVIQAGRHVYVGQKLGESGNTGFSTGPHLHFCVQVNRGLKLVSVPFRLAGSDGPIAIPTQSAAVGAPRPL